MINCIFMTYVSTLNSDRNLHNAIVQQCCKLYHFNAALAPGKTLDVTPAPGKLSMCLRLLLLTPR
jgi:hypothetical protein